VSGKEDQVRAMLDLPHPTVPADLARRAAARGRRIGYRRRVTRRVLWTVLLTAVTVFLVWLAVANPWAAAPVEITPPPQLF
jgi:ferric-dicitrate binding protein FerR (iron transport regulator)